MKEFTFKVEQTDLGHELLGFDNFEVTSQILPQCNLRQFDHKITEVTYTPQDSTPVDVTPLFFALFSISPEFEGKLMKIGQEYLELEIEYYSPDYVDAYED